MNTVHHGSPGALGDVQAAQGFAVPKHTMAQRFGNSVARYVGDEADVAVSTAEANAFASDVSVLVVAVDALSARIDALIAQVQDPR